MTVEGGYPYRYERSATAEVLGERFGDLEPGGGSGFEASVAGRIASLRGHGKLAFADLRDSSGAIQLFAQQDELGENAMEAFTALGVGDIVGAEGEVIRTRRGELSLRVSSVTLLAECTRPMPEKWHGITDTEARYRQRYLDFLANASARRMIEARATANRVARSWLDERAFLEVETPLLQPQAGGAIARPFVTHHDPMDVDLYLRIAPELYLKRLLIGGFERVYELNRCFRNEGLSSTHLFEFTMLEGYEAYADYNDTMSLVEDLVRAIAQAVNGHLSVMLEGRVVDLGPRFERMTMFEAIEAGGGRDLSGLWDGGDGDGLRAYARDIGVALDAAWGRGKIVAEIYEAIGEKNIVEPTFVTGFPKDVSPLAKDHRTIEGFTEQADLVLGGVELAPIYSELNDSAEQERRFAQQAAARAQGDAEATLADRDFLEALAYGMPPAGGFGVGIDRLLVFLTGSDSIRETVTFPILRPGP